MRDIIRISLNILNTDTNSNGSWLLGDPAPPPAPAPNLTRAREVGQAAEVAKVACVRV